MESVFASLLSCRLRPSIGRDCRSSIPLLAKTEIRAIVLSLTEYTLLSSPEWIQVIRPDVAPEMSGAIR